MLINANDDLLVGKYKNNRENIGTIKRILTRSKSLFICRDLTRENSNIVSIFQRSLMKSPFAWRIFVSRC